MSYDNNPVVAVQIPAGIRIGTGSEWGVKFYGNAVDGVRTGSAVGLSYTKNADGTIVSDFDKLPIWGEMRPVELVAYDNNGNQLEYDSKPIYNSAVWCPQFYWRIESGSDDGGAYVWFRVSAYPKIGFSPAFTRANGSKARGAFFGRYWTTPMPGSSYKGSVRGQQPFVYSTPYSLTGAYARDVSNHIPDLTQWDCGESLEAYSARAVLMAVEYATRNVQNVMAGLSGIQWNSLAAAHQSPSASNYVGIPKSWDSGSALGVGSEICIWVSGNAWTCRRITAITDNVDGAGNSDSSYKRLTVSGDPLSLSTNVCLVNMGRAVGDTDGIPTPSGTMVDGTYDGVNSSNQSLHRPKYRYIESPYGEFWSILLGVAVKSEYSSGSRRQTLALYKGNGALNNPSSWAGDTGLTMPGNGTTSGSSDGYIVTIKQYNGNIVPESLGGSSGTYYADYCWWAGRTSDGTSYYEFLAGGVAIDGSRVGPFIANLNAGFGSSSLSCACRPLLIV